MKKSLNCFVLLASLLLTCCTKEGDTIYQPNPNEEQPATTPFVTVIYGPNGLGDRSYNDLIYKGIEMAAKQYGVQPILDLYDEEGVRRDLSIFQCGVPLCLFFEEIIDQGSNVRLQRLQGFCRTL